MPGTRWILDLVLVAGVTTAIAWFVLAGRERVEPRVTVPQHTTVAPDLASDSDSASIAGEVVDPAAVRGFAALFPPAERRPNVAPAPVEPPARLTTEPVVNRTRFSLVSSVRTPDGGTAYYVRDNRSARVVSTLHAAVAVIKLVPGSELVFDYQNERFVVQLR